MEKNIQDLVIEDGKSKAGDLGSIGIGAALGGPFGALLGLGANRLYKWARQSYLDKQAEKKAKQSNGDSTVKNSDKNSNSEEDLAQKIKRAQDAIKDAGMFEPEVYNNHRFYITTIIDSQDPDNDFVYISKKRNGGSANKKFVEYWVEQFQKRYPKADNYDIKKFVEMIKERFVFNTNKPFLISVPQYFLIDDDSVLGMAKNSDIKNKEKVIYSNVSDFDSNYPFDVHMYKYKGEAVEEDDSEQYKVSLISYSVFKTNYTFACDSNPVNNEKLEEFSGSVILSLGKELCWADDETNDLISFSKIVERLVDTEEKIEDVYTVAAPLLKKDTTKTEDLEYNAGLLNGVGVYKTREEFLQNYMEDYQRLLENQMRL